MTIVDGDICADSHDYWFHLVKQPRYFAAVDEVREAHAPKTLTHRGGGESWGNERNPDNNWGDAQVRRIDPLGKLPGSVWELDAERVIRRLILGWSPSGICTACNEGRRPVVEKEASGEPRTDHGMGARHTNAAGAFDVGNRTASARSEWAEGVTATITGYVCACPNTLAPTTPALVWDPFSPTGLVADLAVALERTPVTAVVRGDALAIPLADNSVDLVVTSPPYFALRSYRDDGVHYEHQIGSEPTPQAFLEALWAVTTECWRVLKPSGSLFVNLGDKRSGSGGHNNGNLGSVSRWGTLAHTQTQKTNRMAERDADENESREWRATRRNAPDRYNQAAFGRAKSKMLLPHRYAIGCEDGLADPDGVGWIVRQDIVWSKPNGLPESVTDRVRDSHEYWFHMVKSPRYFAAVDEVREPSISDRTPSRMAKHVGRPDSQHQQAVWDGTPHPLGKLPGSVWSIPSEPLQVPDWLGVDHFAAFPQEWPRRLILGWSPTGICTVCGEGRRPVVEPTPAYAEKLAASQAYQSSSQDRWGDAGGAQAGFKWQPGQSSGEMSERVITGYACACPGTSAPTRPAVVFDPFLGTGTTIGVARALGRTGIGLDLSADYCRLAVHQVFKSGRFSKSVARTHKENQGMLL